MSEFIKINLTNHFNNNGFNNEKGYMADFTVKGLLGRYPMEELPDGKNDVFIDGIPFKFPDKEIEFNNMELQGQMIHFECSRYKKIHVLCAADTGSFNELVTLRDSENNIVSSKYLGVSDWMSPHSNYNEKLAFRFSKSYSIRGEEPNFKPAIWYQIISLEECENQICCIEFRDNPSVHIFCLTLERGEE